MTDDCCGAPPPDNDGYGDCWCTLPVDHEGDHSCEPCTERYGAPTWPDEES